MKLLFSKVVTALQTSLNDGATRALLLSIMGNLAGLMSSFPDLRSDLNAQAILGDASLVFQWISSPEARYRLQAHPTVLQALKQMLAQLHAETARLAASGQPVAQDPLHFRDSGDSDSDSEGPGGGGGGGGGAQAAPPNPSPHITPAALAAALAAAGAPNLVPAAPPANNNPQLQTALFFFQQQSKPHVRRLGRRGNGRQRRRRRRLGSPRSTGAAGGGF